MYNVPSPEVITLLVAKHAPLSQYLGNTGSHTANGVSPSDIGDLEALSLTTKQFANMSVEEVVPC